MPDLRDTRPDPQKLLSSIQHEQELSQKGKLKIFFGMCAGVGKTYTMLMSAREANGHGVELVVGYVETHKRVDTEALLTGLELLPRQRVEYHGAVLEEFDLDAALTRAPSVILVDELAHTNVPGSRHAKRYQDVLELLDRGIDVYTTLNVQHLESRAETVAQITGSIVRETVPDSVFDRADEVELIDITTGELQKRLAEGKVYAPERSQRAADNFFRTGNLTALREMALRVTAERVDSQLRDYMRRERISGPWKSGQRLLVAVSPSPHSMALIRWARRMAHTMDASWIAVYVEPPEPADEKVKLQLGKNIQLARELGAEIVSTSDHDLAGALIRVAREHNATQLLVGKSAGSRTPFQHSLIDRLVAMSGNLDISVVGGDDTQAGKRSWLSVQHSSWSAYVTAMFVVSVVVLICYPLSNWLGYQTVAFVLLFAVSLLPLRLGPGPVLIAATMSALSWDFFFIPPRFTIYVARLEDVLMLLTYFSIAAVTGFLSARSRSRSRALLLREQRVSALYSLTNDLAAARSRDEVVTAAIRNIEKTFGGNVVVFLGTDDGDMASTPHPASTVTVEEKEKGAAAWVYWNEKSAGRFTNTLPSVSLTFFPLSGPRYPLGVVGIKLPGDTRLSLEPETLLESFMRQIATAVERETLNAITKKAVVVQESERLYKTLFDSVSHEMRTPLAAIIGAAEAMDDAAVASAPAVRNELLHQVRDAAARLNRVVQNLLDMTRIESGLVVAKKDWCDAGDLLRAAVSRLSKELEGHPVAVEVEPGIPLLRVDFGLMEQTLCNLLLNAAQYSPPGSEIRAEAKVEGSTFVLDVSDRGPGLPSGAIEEVFKKFYRVPGTATGGTGLGLSIVRGFVEAHGGTISVANRAGGGTIFSIHVPVEHVQTAKELSGNE